MTAVWIDQSTRMKGDRFICGDCGREWPTISLGPPFESDRCYRGRTAGEVRCAGRLTAVWDIYPGCGEVAS